MEFLSGSEVLVRGAISAGCRAFFGYPITPSSEIMELMEKELRGRGGVFMQTEDEIAASAAAIGASWAGAKAMTATSGPGFSLMQENIGLATMLEIPLVVIDVQRIGPSTGIPTIGAQQDLMQAIWGRHGDQFLIVFCPSDFAELFSMTVKAFNSAELLRTPVILLTDGHLVTLSSTVNLVHTPVKINRKMLERKNIPFPLQTDQSLVPGFPPLGQGYAIIFESLAHDERGFPTSNTRKARKLLRRLKSKFMRNMKDIWTHEESGVDGSDDVVVSYGSSAIPTRYAIQIARNKGISPALLVLKCLWPLDETVLSRILHGKKRIIVVEQTLGQLIWLLRPFMDKNAELISVTSIGRPPQPERILKVIMHED